MEFLTEDGTGRLNTTDGVRMGFETVRLLDEDWWAWKSTLAKTRQMLTGQNTQHSSPHNFQQQPPHPKTTTKNPKPQPSNNKNPHPPTPHYKNWWTTISTTNTTIKADGQHGDVLIWYSTAYMEDLSTMNGPISHIKKKVHSNHMNIYTHTKLMNHTTEIILKLQNLSQIWGQNPESGNINKRKHTHTHPITYCFVYKLNQWHPPTPPAPDTSENKKQTKKLKHQTREFPYLLQNQYDKL